MLFQKRVVCTKFDTQKIVERDFIYYNIIAIKWGESTHFPGRNDPGRIDPGRTGNRGETTRIQLLWLTPAIILAISWQPVVVVEEAGVPGENHRP